MSRSPHHVSQYQPISSQQFVQTGHSAGTAYTAVDKPLPKILMHSKTLSSKPQVPGRPLKDKANSAPSRSCLQVHDESWALQLSAILGSAALLAAMTIIMKTYDNRSITDWNSQLTLNALIGALVSILYLFLVSTISSCISQLKWNHFRVERRLMDYERFDNASRGTVGALTLMFSRTSFIAHFAAFLTIAVQAIGPFTQQIIGVASLPFPSEQPVYISAARTFNQTIKTGMLDMKYDARWENSHQMTPATAFSQGLPNDIISSVMAGIFSISVQDYSPRSTCGSNQNCSWEPFASLGVRSQCANLTSLLETPLNYDYSKLPEARLPNGFVWSLPVARLSDNETSFQVSSSQASIAFQDETGVFLNTQMIYVEAGPIMAGNPGFRSELIFGRVAAWECILQFVAQPVVANATGAAYQESASGTAAYSETRDDIRGPLLQNATMNRTNIDLAGDDEAPTLGGDATTYAFRASTCVISYPCSFKKCPHAPFSNATYWLTNTTACDLSNYKPPTMQWEGQNFTVDPATISLLTRRLFNLFNGTIYAAGWPSRGTISTDDTVQFGPALGVGFPVVSRLYQAIGEAIYGTLKVGTEAPLTVSDVFNNTAKSLTKAVRELDGVQVEGRASSNKAAYTIDWPWIAAPSLLLVATAALLGFTMYDTRRTGTNLWRESGLAGITRGAGLAGQYQLVEQESVHGLQACAREMPARLDAETGILVPVKKAPT